MKNTNLASTICLLIIFTVFSSCERKDSNQKNAFEIIKVDLSQNLNEKRITIEQVIPLESTDESLFGYVKRAFFWDDKIIILDTKQQTIFFFDSLGNYLHKTKRGKGPNELDDPWDCNIDYRDSTILLYDRMSITFKKLDFNGNVIKSDRVKRMYLNNFHFLGGDSLLIQRVTRTLDSEGNERYTTYSIVSDEYTNVYDFEYYLEIGRPDYFLKHPLDTLNNSFLLVGSYDYNIYELCDGDLNLRYQFDFGENGLEPWQLETFTLYQMLEMFDDTNDPKVPLFKSLIVNNQNLIIDAAIGKKGYVFVHSLKEKKTYNLNSCFEKGILPYCEIWGKSEDGSIFAIVEPEDFIEFSKINTEYKSLEIILDDNPILITFKIKS